MVGRKLIIFSVIAVGAGAAMSVLSALSYLEGAQGLVEHAAGTAAGQQDIPAYMPLALLAVLIMSVVAHESAHGLAAYWCGDNTARDEGRITLNPLKHLDFFGSLVLPVLLFFVADFALGYAKPVPINTSRFRYQSRDRIIASSAGATANMLLAAISLGLLAAVSFAIVMFWPDAGVSGFSGFLDVPSFSNIAAPWLWAGLVQVLKSLFIVNVVLAIFNMIPIPPLDGSHVLENLLPGRMRFYFGIMRISGFLVILIVLVVLMYAGVLGTLVELAIRGASAPIRLVTHLG